MLVLHYATSLPSTKLIVNAAEILTYTVDIKAENRARPVQKAKVSSVVLFALVNLKVLLGKITLFHFDVCNNDIYELSLKRRITQHYCFLAIYQWLITKIVFYLRWKLCWGRLQNSMN